MSLFQWGDFTLHSGDKSWWRIDCDVLSDSEIELLAKLIHEKVGGFHSVIAPESHPGSAAPKLAEALKKYSVDWGGQSKWVILAVDDVLSTGASLEELRVDDPILEYKGAVIFARGKCADWITPLFQMPTEDECPT